jgi:hypothetical protein
VRQAEEVDEEIRAVLTGATSHVNLCGGKFFGGQASQIARFPFSMFRDKDPTVTRSGIKARQHRPIPK